jgi:hypothetical protein
VLPVHARGYNNDDQRGSSRIHIDVLGQIVDVSLKSKKSYDSYYWWSHESTHVIVVMSFEEENAAIKLNHMIHNVNVQSLNYIFHFNFPMNVLMVKVDIVFEEIFFVVSSSVSYLA